MSNNANIIYSNFDFNDRESYMRWINELKFTFQFTDKESYLAWRQEWKKVYKSLSSDIRRLKSQVKNEMRENNYSHQLLLRYMRRDAASMMEELELAKERSWAMKQEALKKDLVDAE